MSNKFGNQRHNVRRKVVRMRLKDEMSWADIAEALECAPRTARRLFQEAQGEGQHHDHLEGKGGRFPAGRQQGDKVVTYVPAKKGEVTVHDGQGNEWKRQERKATDA